MAALLAGGEGSALAERALPRLRQIVIVLAGFAVAWAGASTFLPKGAPVGIILDGLVFGSLYALTAMGLVLIYRANRVVNFAQAEFGSVAAVVAIEMALHGVNYFLAVGIGLVLALAVGALVNVAIIRRFRKAPRLILAVATIGLSQVLAAIALIIPLLWEGVGAHPFRTPFSATFRVTPKLFSADYIVAIVAILVVMVGIASFLRFTDYGVAIRAAAENGDRANLLGIPVPRLATMVWALAALLSALGAILRVPLLGFASFASVSGAGNAMLLRTLAAAVIGRMENLPRTVLAALGIGVFERVAIWNLPRTTVVDAMLVVVILAALLAQRDFFARVAETGISSWKAIREVRPVPSELRTIPEVRWAFRGLKVALVAFALLFPVFAQPNQDLALTEVLIYSIVAASLLILTGWAGHISLGQFALVGFGGATTAILYGRHHWDFFFAFIAGVIAASLVALVIGLPALRVRGPFLAVTTLAFAVTSSTYFLEDRYFPWFIQTDIPRPKLWGRLPLDHPWQLYLFALAMFGLVMFGVRNLRNSHAGRVLIATRDNELASEAVTLNVTRLKLSAFLISGAIAGVAGGIYVLYQNGINTDSYGADVSIRLFSMVVIGGLGSLPGVVLGAVYVWGVQFFLPPAYALLASGAGILMLLIFLPEGLGGLVYTVRDNYLRWVANRHGILVPSLVADRRIEEAEEQQASVAIGTALAGLRADGAEVVADVIGATPPDAPPIDVRGPGHRELAGRGA